MFAKLLKQEFRATRGILGLLCAAALGGALLGGGSLRYLIGASQNSDDATASVVLFALLLTASILFLAACCVIMVAVLIGRFYRSRFTDEGYLTFTLPVNGHQILLSSLVSSVVNTLVMVAAVLLSLILMLFLGLSGMEEFRKEFPLALRAFFQTLGENFRLTYLSTTLLSLLCLIAGLAGEASVIMLSVTLGSLKAKKHKILAAVGFCYLFHTVMSILGVAGLVYLAFLPDFTAGWSPQMGTAVSCAVWLIIAACCYFPTHYLVTRRLNLP